MKDSSSQPLVAWLISAAFLGVLFGLLLKDVALWFSFASSLYLNALVLVVFPLILSSVLVGLVNLGDYRKLGPIGYKTIGLFLAGSGIAAILGIGLALIIGPGRDVPALVGAPLSSTLVPESLSSIGGFLSTLIPANLIGSTGGGQYLGLAIVALILGGVLSTMATKVRGIVTFVRGFHEVMERVVGVLLRVSPIGLFFVMSTAIAVNRDALGDTGFALLKLSLVVVIGLIIHLLVVLPTFMIVFARRNPVGYYKNLWPAMVTGLVTGSSVATFPVTYNNVIEENEVDPRAGSIVLPLSLSLNMNGSALFLAAASIFVLQVFGLPITIWVILKILVAALLVSMGVSGIPSGALFGLAAIGAFGGFSTQALAAFASLLTIDWLLDRFRTVVNVAGDGVAAAVISEVFEFKTVGRKALSSGGRGREPRQPRRTSRSAPGPSDRGRGRDDAKPERRTRDRRERPQRAERRSPATRDSATKRGSGDSAEKSSRRSEASRPRRDDRQDRRDRPDRRQSERSENQDRPKRDRRDDARSRRPDRPDRSDRQERPDRRETRPTEPDKPVKIDNAPDAEVKPAEIKAEVEAEAAALALSPETIKRELSQVRAQLRDADDEDAEPTMPTEKPSKSEPAVDDTNKHEPAKTETAPKPKSKPNESERQAAPAPAARSVQKDEPPAKRPEKPKEHQPEPEPKPKAEVTPKDDKDEESSETPREISFGRSLRKKGKPKSGEAQPMPGPVDAEGETSESASTRADSYSNEDISFGRGKRKKA